MASTSCAGCVVASEAEREAARKRLADHITAAIQEARRTSPQPALVIKAAPMVLASLAGNYVLQFIKCRAFNDGQAEKMMEELVRAMADHANPALDPCLPFTEAEASLYRLALGMNDG